MPLPKSDIGIARNIKTIEWLKAELVTATGHLFKSLVRGAEDAVLDALAYIVITTFILARRLGFSFSVLDAAIARRVRDNIDESHEIEEWFGDFSALLHYFEETRGDDD